jgi:asparaginyl-tRNA synthetase
MSSPPLVTIAQLHDHVGKDVTLRGWLYNKRGAKKLQFLEVRDGSGIVQAVVVLGEVPDAVFAQADKLAQETSLVVTGTVREHAKRKGEYELGVKELQVVGAPVGEYPISPKEHGTDFLMDHRHLWLRSKRQHAILRVRHEIIRSVRDYFDSHGFTLVDAPIFTPNASEGTSTLFETDYHGEKAYLTQSGQLYMEAAAMAVGKAYCFGPTFRAEKSKTRRHLAEFWMVEPEVAYLDLDGDMDLAEDFLVYVVGRVLEQKKEEFKILERDTTHLERVQKNFPRITYEQAIGILQEAYDQREREGKLVRDAEGRVERRPAFGDDFGGDEETVISSRFDRPVMVHRYPAEIKAFYLKRDPNDARLALGVDVLAPEGYGEIIGGGERETELDKLVASIEHHKLPMSAFEWYLDLRRYGSVPHAGFGLGIERTVAWTCGLQHVRETIPFPRMLNRLSP